MKTILAIAFSLLSILSISTCNWMETSSTGSVEGPSFVFLPQGDRITVGKQAFMVKNGSGALLYEGSVSSMENLFYRLTVEHTTIPQSVPQGALLFALPVEGTLMAMFMGYSAVTGSTHATFMEIKKPLSPGGVCPTAGAEYVGRTRPSPTRTRENLFYGLGRISPGTDGLLRFQTRMVSMKNDFSAVTDYTDAMTGFKPDTGSASNTDGATMFFSPSGTILVKAGDTPDDIAYYLLPYTVTSPSAGEITANGVEYRGWVEFLTPEPNVKKVAQPIAFHGNGTNLTGGPYTKFGQNEVDATRTITIDKSLKAPAGVFDISLNSREGYPSQTRRIVAGRVNGRIILLGVGDRDGNEDGDFEDPTDWITSFLVQMQPDR